MIIKGQSRGRSSQLAAHLLRRDQNEDIRLYELRRVVATDVAGALAEMEALAAAVHSKRPLYHASISPEAHRPLTDDQIRTAADVLERKLGLAGQPRLVVVHRKQGREHLHVVWSRIDLARQGLIPDSWSYRAHEEASRELEAAFGHRVIRGKHGPRAYAPRPRQASKGYEYRQAERSGVPPQRVSAELGALWHASETAEAFRKKLEEAGYTLARGDRRVFVVIDRAGNAHSLARRLGIRSQELRARLAGLPLDALPSVAEARERLGQRAGQTALHARYRATASEIAAPRVARRRAATARPGRAARSRIASAIGWINMPAHAPGPIVRRVAPRFTKPSGSRYRVACAIILAEYASKIAAAMHDMLPDELDAALARLRAEREAALDALGRAEHGLSYRAGPRALTKRRRRWRRTPYWRALRMYRRRLTSR
jgi:hypothetical protein